MGWVAQDDDILPRTLVETATDNHTRRAVLARLREKYPAIAQLNRAWGTDLPEWETLESRGCRLDEKQRAAAGADFRALLGFIAERYFSTCRAAMDAAMPGCLYLGPRMNVFTLEVVEQAARHCDVVSFNVYAPSPSAGGKEALLLAKRLDFPMLVGEYHFNALDSGLFGRRPVAVETQEERAAGFTGYLRDALAHPNCVGTHWFQYADQPVTGRPDGENFNIGFVTVTDTPYPLLRAAARETGRKLYELRKQQ
jgi:hypothetical protein